MNPHQSGEPIQDRSRLDPGGFLRAAFLTAPMIVIATVVLGSLSLILSLVDPAGKRQSACAGLWVRFVLKMASVRVVVRGLENVRPGTGYIVCPNHQSQIDVPVLMETFPNPLRFAAKKELFRVPFFGWHLTRAGHIAVDRDNARRAMKSMRRAVGLIGEGVSVVVFPEGRTSRDGAIQPFRRGAFFLASEAGADVLPVTIRGSRHILPSESWLLAAGDVEVTIHAPVSSNQWKPGELAARTRDVIAGHFGDGGVRKEHSGESWRKTGQPRTNSL